MRTDIQTKTMISYKHNPI